MDERALIAAARRGDADCFNRLVQWHQGVAYDVAYRLLGRPDAAEAMQEAILAAYRALPGFRAGSFRAWLLRMVVEACRRRARVARGRPPAGGEGCTAAQAVGAAIARLPLETRVVLVLADVQGLSYEEVAQVTGAAPEVVARQLGSARAQLRDWLRGEGSGTQRATEASSRRRR